MFDAVIVGGGPAGIGVLSSLYQLRQSTGDQQHKLCLIESEALERSGHLAAYQIPSDTRAEKFLTCLDGLAEPITSDPTLTHYADALRGYGPRAAPLPLVGAFYRTLGECIGQDMTARDHLQVKAQTKAVSALWDNNFWHIKTQSNGRAEAVQTQTLILACGATETYGRLDGFLQDQGLTRENLTSTCLSSDILKAGPNAPIFKRLQGLENPKVVIIGGSHSAISSAGKLLLQDIPFSKAGITIMHRRPMYVTFDSAQDARQCGFNAFTHDDICPHTNRVYALKGFRLDSRDLLMAIQGYDDGPAEKRAALSSLKDMTPSAINRTLKHADLVISALGYTPRYIPLYRGQAGREIELNAPHYVNEKSQLLDHNEKIIPNCYGLGLASNFNLAKRYGEPSFKGQANGLVLWHKDIGMDIASSVMGG